MAAILNFKLMVLQMYVCGRAEERKGLVNSVRGQLRSRKFTGEWSFGTLGMLGGAVGVVCFCFWKGMVTESL